MFSIEVAAIVTLFLIFIYLVYRGIKLLFRYIIIAFISALFPIIMIVVFGVSWPLTLRTILAFIYLGILGYTIYLCLSVIEIFLNKIVKMSGRKKEKALEKRVEKLEKKEKEE